MPADWGRAQLETLDFVDRCEDLVLYGPVGTGKTHLAVALGRLACMRAIPVRFFTATGLLMRLRRAKREDRLDTELRQIAKARLPVIDESGYMPIDEEGSRLLFQVISDSYETRSVVYTTNIEFSGWGRVLGDKNMAAALIDRTVHHGRLAGFEGGSYRSEHALMTRQPRKKGRRVPTAQFSAGNQPPMLPKNSAHTVDANLQKHNPHDRTGEMRAVRMPARRDDVSPQLAALRLAPRVTPLVDRHRETQRSSEQVQQDLLAGIHTATPLNLELSDIPLSRHAKRDSTYFGCMRVDGESSGCNAPKQI